MYPALQAAVAYNVGIIQALLISNPQASLDQIKKACTEQGYCDDLSIQLAIDQHFKAS
jgi:hypothetical protein